MQVPNIKMMDVCNQIETRATEQVNVGIRKVKLEDVIVGSSIVDAMEWTLGKLNGNKKRVIKGLKELNRTNLELEVGSNALPFLRQSNASNLNITKITKRKGKQLAKHLV